MIEVHIVGEPERGGTGDAVRLVVGDPHLPATLEGPEALFSISVEVNGSTVAGLDLGPESARVLHDEIARRARAKGRLL